jgi:hypothetical protein
MKNNIVTVSIVLVILAMMGCSSMPSVPNAFTASADPALQIQEQAVIAESGNTHIYGVDNNTTFSRIHYFIVPPGRHKIITRYYVDGTGTDEISLYHDFEAGHYYVVTAIPNDAAGTVAISIEDRTTSEWWIENKEAFYTKNSPAIRYGKGKSN